MRSFYILAGLLFFLAASFSAAAPIRYQDKVFTNATVTSDIVYGSNYNPDGSPITLKLDLYQPSGDTAHARPLVIYMFGGGFAVGSKTDGDMVLLSQTMAKRGYVAASIQYRIDPALISVKPADGVARAAFRGMQDAKAAVRFLRAHKAEYRIDDTRILIGGCSAGAFIALQVAFLDAKEIPAAVDTNQLGGMEGKSGTPGVSSAVNGVLNNWGALDSTWLFNGNLPVISFAGTADPEVPYDHKGSLGGSACIHRVLTRQKVYSVLKPFPNMGHGMGTNDPRYDTLLTMQGQFAYDVLFKNVTTSIVPEARIQDRTDRRGQGFSNFGNTFLYFRETEGATLHAYDPRGRRHDLILK
jgi:poly(3-hydroxybutyrate) depolymerase